MNPVLSDRAISDRAIDRLAMISLHTSPLDQPGTGDAGGMNVYVIELARRLAAQGIEVDIFTRATSSALPPVVEAADGVRVRHIHAGPFEGLTKGELPGQLCVFAREVLRSEAAQPVGHYDAVHSHYWLSGQVGALARDRWGVPLVHSMHTMARVKNDALAIGDTPEPAARIIGEQQVVEAADMLIANTDIEAKQLINLYDADPGRVEVVHPGVDLAVFRPGDEREARRSLGLPADAHVLMFAGRIQPLKAPDVLLRAVAVLLEETPSLRSRLVVPVVGGPSGTGLEHPESLAQLAAELGCRRRRTVRAAGRPGRAGPLVHGRHPGRRTVLQRVVRPGRRRGAGHRHPRHRGRRGRADHGDPRRSQRAPGRRPRAPRLGQRDASRDGGRRPAVPAPGGGGRAGAALLLGADRREHARHLPPGPRVAAGRGVVTAEAIRSYLDDNGIDYDQVGDGVFSITLPGEKKLQTPVRLDVGPHALGIHAFVCRKPDENHEGVYRWLLQRNLKMYGVAFALDAVGDIYLDGRLPLSAVTPEELDRLLGSVLSYADESFNSILELGFASSIRKEWEWRRLRGESTRNLEAFRGWLESGG